MKFTTRREDLTAPLRGRGIEIGALDAPFPVPAGVEVTYVDRLTREECLRHYPELPRPEAVLAPDLIAPAENLAPLGDGSQDFVIASHLLEHMGDPIGALKEWYRVLRPGGHLVLVLPDKRRTFDAPRERTSLRHLVLDHRQPPDHPERRRRDFAAYREWVQLAKRLRTPAQVDFWARLLQRAGYSIHFHCWIPEDLRELFAHLAAAEDTPLRLLVEASLKDGWEFGFLLQAEK